MKKEYDLNKLKKRPGKVKIVKAARKVPVNMRIDAQVLSRLKSQAALMGLPYQTLLGSILYRYTEGTLVESDKPRRPAA